MKRNGKSTATVCLIVFLTFVLVASAFAGEATLAWDAPTTNEDGTALGDLAGFRVYYGAASGGYSSSIDVGKVTTYRVTGLTNGLTYYFATSAYDSAGNESAYSNEASMTPATADTSAPVISGVYAGDVTVESATINWTTDEASDTRVEYGATLALGSSTALDPSPVTTHSQGVSGLSPSTQYYYRVLSADAAGNAAVSETHTFTTSDPLDTTPPVITAVQTASITDSSAIISWTTDEPSSSRVEHGLASAYGSITPLVSDPVTMHSVEITGLSSFTTYVFRVRSADAAGNEAMSAEHSFTTSNLSPVITAFSAAPATGTVPLLVDFTAQASDPDGAVVAFEWDFDGDGTFDENTGAVSSASHIYSNEGACNVRLKITDNGGASTISPPVTITATSALNEPPVVSSVKTSPNAGTAPLTVVFSTVVSDPDGKIVLYEWDFDGNGVFDAQTAASPVSHTYQTPGTFTAKVRFTDDGGASASGETVITVSADPGQDQGGTGTDVTPPGSMDSTIPSPYACFIATAAYGSSLAPDVVVLRKFRDEYLLGSLPGRAFVAAYYRLSPQAADFISRHEALRVATRRALAPIVYGIKFPRASLGGIIVLAGIVMFLIAHRKRNRHEKARG